MTTDWSSDPVAVLRRWAEAGGIWRVVRRTTDTVTISLCQCTGGEEVDRLTSGDPTLRAYVADRESSED